MLRHLSISQQIQCQSLLGGDHTYNIKMGFPKVVKTYNLKNCESKRKDCTFHPFRIIAVIFAPVIRGPIFRVMIISVKSCYTVILSVVVLYFTGNTQAGTPDPLHFHCGLFLFFFFNLWHHLIRGRQSINITKKDRRKGIYLAFFTQFSVCKNSNLENGIRFSVLWLLQQITKNWVGKKTEIYSLTLLDVRGLKSKYGQGYAPLNALEKYPFLVLSSSWCLQVSLGFWESPEWPWTYCLLLFSMYLFLCVSQS